jgi:hypothetical protein
MHAAGVFEMILIPWEAALILGVVFFDAQPVAHLTFKDAIKALTKPNPERPKRAKLSTRSLNRSHPIGAS